MTARSAVFVALLLALGLPSTVRSGPADAPPARKAAEPAAPSVVVELRDLWVNRAEDTDEVAMVVDGDLALRNPGTSEVSLVLGYTLGYGAPDLDRLILCLESEEGRRTPVGYFNPGVIAGAIAPMIVRVPPGGSLPLHGRWITIPRPAPGKHRAWLVLSEWGGIFSHGVRAASRCAGTPASKALLLLVEEPP